MNCDSGDMLAQEEQVTAACEEKVLDAPGACGRPSVAGLKETSHHRHGTKAGGLIASLAGELRSVRTVAQQRPESDTGQQLKGDKTRCIMSGVFGIELGNFNGRVVVVKFKIIIWQVG